MKRFLFAAGLMFLVSSAAGAAQLVTKTEIDILGPTSDSTQRYAQFKPSTTAGRALAYVHVPGSFFDVSRAVSVDQSGLQAIIDAAAMTMREVFATEPTLPPAP